jgi:hypothetical protein
MNVSNMVSSYVLTKIKQSFSSTNTTLRKYDDITKFGNI